MATIQLIGLAFFVGILVGSVIGIAIQDAITRSVYRDLGVK